MGLTEVVWQVVQRELREQARRPSSWALKAGGAAAALAALWSAAHDQRVLGGATDGAALFGRINVWLLLLGWLVGPALTADCLSSERREGTLGLLFLTPLRPREVVAAKAAAIGLRAAALVASTLPVFAIPVLAGGVGWMDLTRLALTHAAVWTAALCAGLVASSFVDGWMRVRLAAVVVAAAAAGLLAIGQSFLVALSYWRGVGGAGRVLVYWRWVVDRWSEKVRYGWVSGAGVGAHTGVQSLFLAFGFLALGLTLAGLAMRFASALLNRTWRPAPPRPRIDRAIAVTTRRPLFPEWARRRRDSQLHRNPSLWLGSRTWQSRVAPWLAIGGVALFYAARLASPGWGEGDDSAVAAWVVVAVGAVAGASSYRLERESGAMELLLTTPTPAASWVDGRIIGLTLAFAPTAFLVRLPLWFEGGRELLGGFRNWNALEIRLVPWVLTAGTMSAVFGVTAASLAVCLRRGPLVAAVLGPLAGWHLVKSATRSVADLLVPNGREISAWGIEITAALVAIAFGFWCRRLAIRALERRQFLPPPERRGLGHAGRPNCTATALASERK